MTQAPQPGAAHLDFFVLADRAEAINGKLYMMGGCWDRLQLPQFPTVQSVGLAGRVRIPDWEAREDFAVTFHIRGPQSPEITPGGIQFLRSPAPAVNAPFALFAVGALVTFREPGAYVIEALVNGANGRTAEFTVDMSPAQA